jgi:type IV secretory pathway TraG/TraD family ATPase VirD4
MIDGETYGNVWFEFDGIAFPTKESLEMELSSRKQQMINEAQQDLRGIALSICPVSQGTNDSSWEQGAQDYLYGIMLAMLEDSVDERLGEDKMRLDQFNFYNLYRIANKRDADPDNPFGSVKKYINGRLKTSEVKGLCSPVIDNSPGTTKSYLGVLAGKVSQLMGDMGICYATSGTDINFSEIVDRPTAFFIKVPDHKKERHPLATICISQLYRALVDKANQFPGLKLPRHVYFFLDEFGNLPVIPDFATMVTVSRSRRIFFEIILQSYKQLDIKYGPDEAQNIRGNFQMEVFLGSEDPSTIQAFSDACGEITVFHDEENVSRNTKDTSQGENISKSVQRTRKPLIDKQQLRQLERWTVVAKIFRKAIMKDVMTPFFDTPCMKKSSAKEPISISRPLDVQSIFYDIDKRNSIVFMPKSPFED